MGIRVNASNLMGLRAITQATRKFENKTTVDTPVSQLEAHLSSTTNSSPAPSEVNTKLSNELYRSFAQNSLDARERNYSTEGIGSRALAVTTNAPEFLDQKFPDTDPIVADPLLYDANSPISQEDMLQLRSTIAQIARNYVGANPNSTTEDGIRAEVDNQLGSGVADLFNLRVVDLGAGESAVQYDNIDPAAFTPTENQTLIAAANNARENFDQVSTARMLKGHDVDQIVSKIDDLFGFNAKLVLDDFKNTLSKPNHFSEAAQKLLEDSKDFLNVDDRAKLKGFLEDLQKLDDQNLEAFNKHPLADDVSISWTSRRYGPAWDSETIASNAELTNTPDWTTAIRLGTIRDKNRYTG